MKEKQQKTTKNIKIDIEKNYRFKQFFEYTGLSQKEFASKIGTTQQYISSFLNSGRNIGINIVNRMKSEFDYFNEYWFLTGNGEMLKSTASIPEEKSVTEEPRPVLDTNDCQKQVLMLNEDIIHYKRKITHLEEEMAFLERRLSKREDVISNLESQISERDAKISTLESKIAEREEKLSKAYDEMLGFKKPTEKPSDTDKPIKPELK